MVIVLTAVTKVPEQAPVPFTLAVMVYVPVALVDGVKAPEEVLNVRPAGVTV